MLLCLSVHIGGGRTSAECAASPQEDTSSSILMFKFTRVSVNTDTLCATAIFDTLPRLDTPAALGYGGP
jgi:hypothetical protein